MPNLLIVNIVEPLETLKQFAADVKLTFEPHEFERIVKRITAIVGSPISLTTGESGKPLVVETQPTSKGQKRGLWSFGIYRDDENEFTNKQLATIKRNIRKNFIGYSSDAKINFETLNVE